jgi:hypothetical protein
VHGTEHDGPEEAAQVADRVDLVRVRVKVRVGVRVGVGVSVRVGVGVRVWVRVRVRVRVRARARLTTAMEHPRSAAGCVVWCSAQCVGTAAWVAW